MKREYRPAHPRERSINLSTVLGKTVTSPFAVLARGKDGKLSYVQFMEDTFAAARSFLESGAYRIKSDPDGSSVDV